MIKGESQRLRKTLFLFPFPFLSFLLLHQSSGMKFGRYLVQNIEPSYSRDDYLAYDRLKNIIKRLVERQLSAVANLEDRQVSLSMPPPTNQLGAVSDLTLDLRTRRLCLAILRCLL